ncbi:MAG: hypothetical protein CAF45_007855 [Nitrospira sp. CG24E]|nr:MAG: hypothetical protein CAF45_007855 [Nitrospira sp. CG24E]
MNLSTLLHPEIAAPLIPIDEQPDYREKLDLLARLKVELRSVTAEREQAASRVNHTSRTPVVDGMVQQYLEGHAITPDIGYQQRLEELANKYRALLKAIDQTERELTTIRFRLSAVTAEDQKAEVREHARDALRGLLIVQRAQAALKQLCLDRRDRGYFETFRHCVVPGTDMGELQDPNSVLRIVLQEFRDAEYLTEGEHRRLASGVTVDFER